MTSPTPKVPTEADLAGRVAELTDCLEWVRGYISRYDPPGLPNHVAQRIDAALSATTPESKP